MNDQNFTKDTSTQSTTGKILSTGLKIDGWNYRGRMIKNVLFGIVMLLLGCYVAYQGNLAMGGVLLLFAIILFIGSWFYWWRSKSLVKGKFYVPEDKLNS